MKAISQASSSVVERVRDAGGLGLVVVALDADAPEAAGYEAGQVRIGTSRGGSAPTAGLDDFDILLSADPDAPAPWVGLTKEGFDVALARLREVVDRQPVAATVAAQVCRMTLAVPFEEALVLESMGYSMLLASGAFKTWRGTTAVNIRGDQAQPRVDMRTADGVLEVRLVRPWARNAIDARMRDALVEALSFAADDPEAGHVILSGEGPDFSAGGDLDEFGSADDPGLAHAIRVLRSAARAAHDLGPRLTVRVHGACIGAGIEVPAAAARVTARPGSHFRLPEVSMGLIPGAGGTATIPRRIGRQRACYMAISGCDLDLETALAWGLVDDVDEAR